MRHTSIPRHRQLGRPRESDHNAPCLGEDDVGLGSDARGVRQHLGARGAVRVVGQARRIPRPALHGHRETELDELLDHVGDGRHALFACGSLGGNDYQRFGPPPGLEWRRIRAPLRGGANWR